MAGDTGIVVSPSTIWAQKRNMIIVSYIVECIKPDIIINEQELIFKGKGTDGKQYEAILPLFNHIIPSECIQKNCGRTIEVTCPKKEPGTWNSLTGDGKKRHWLKVDFAKTDYGNDGDSDGEDMQGLSASMENFGRFAEEQDKPSFDDIDTDSDDETLPDLV